MIKSSYRRTLKSYNFVWKVREILHKYMFLMFFTKYFVTYSLLFVIKLCERVLFQLLEHPQIKVYDEHFL